MRNTATLSPTVLFLLSSLLSACGGGGGDSADDSDSDSSAGGAPSGTVNFTGGTLAELEAFSPGLSFDELIISGQLILPRDGVTTISANRFSMPQGSQINIASCSDRGSLAIVASESVHVAGIISLSGFFGAANGACGCDGGDGSDLSVAAPEISIASLVQTGGGPGGIFAGTGCRGGDAGLISIAGTNIDFSNAQINSRRGSGGSGNPRGTSGTVGAIDIVALQTLTVLPGSLATDGAMRVTAASTDIFAELDYATIDESINNQSDTQAPVISIVSPLPGSFVVSGSVLTVVFTIEDNGTGVREGTISGVGLAPVAFSSDDFDAVTRQVSVVFGVPQTSGTITVEGIDNKNNSASETTTILLLGST